MKLLNIAQTRRSKAFNYSGKLDPEEWAEEVYRLPNGARFRWDYAPYTRRIFRSYFDPAVIEVCLMLYSRGLKSTTALLKLGYTIDQDPCRILSLWPTNSQAEKFVKDILVGELFDTTEPLNYLGSAAKKRTGSNTILHKTFPGGLIDLFGANAPGDMRRAKGQLLYAEEIDAIDETVTDEGDQLEIFFKRGAEYAKALRITASYPSVKGKSKIAARYAESDGNQWWSHCVKCGDPLVMHRSMLRYEKERAETARMECPLCHEFLTDAQRYEMAHRQGDDNWKPQREFKGRRGFHANAMLWPHPFDPQKYPAGFLQMLAQQEIDASKAENPRRALRVLVNTVDAEPFDPTEENEKPPEWRTIFNRRESYAKAPLGCVVLTCMVDVQVNRLEVEWKGWGRDEQSWGLAHRVLDGNTKDVDVWQKALVSELQSTFVREDGATLSLNMGFIDGGWAAEYVYGFMQWLAKHRPGNLYGRVRASKGFGKHGHPVIDTNWRTIAKQLKGYHIGTWEAKDLINHRLKLEAGEPGFMHYPQTYGETYFQQLCTGVVTIDYEKGEEVRKFLNEAHYKDEGLDLAVGNLAAFRLRRWNFDALEEQLQATIPKDEVPVPKTKPVVVHSYVNPGRKWTM